MQGNSSLFCQQTLLCHSLNISANLAESINYVSFLCNVTVLQVPLLFRNFEYDMSEFKISLFENIASLFVLNSHRYLCLLCPLNSKSCTVCPFLGSVKQRFFLTNSLNQCEAVGRVVDIIQIPAFLCRQVQL